MAISSQADAHRFVEMIERSLGRSREGGPPGVGRCVSLAVPRPGTPRSKDDPFSLDSLSPETRALVARAARCEGMSIAEWLSRSIRDSAMGFFASQVGLEADANYAKMIPRLVRRIEKLEKRLESNDERG